MATPPGIGTKAQNQEKSRGDGNVLTGESLENGRTALHVLDKSSNSSVGTDVVDSIAGNVITAAAHAARKGDIIRMTSGDADQSEFRVFEVATNTITLEQDGFTLAPAAADTFQILRPTSMTVATDGTISVTSGPLSFTRNAATQIVTEDTATPANNRPLPVKLTDFSGDMILNPNNLNLEVQTSHVGANADSMRIGDGTNEAAVSAALDLQTEDSLGNALLTTIDTDTGVIAGDTTSIDGKTPALGAAVIASSVPVNIASDQTVNVGQATHDSLNANANLQVGDADNTATNPVFTDRLTVVDLLDTPLLDATTLNGSGGALVDVVAVLASAVKKVQLVSTAGVFLGLFDDTVLVAQFGPGSDDTVAVSIAASSVIALRSLETAAPAGGSVVVNFLG